VGFFVVGGGSLQWTFRGILCYSVFMRIEEVKRLYDQEPFHPFILHLADGRQLTVQHREFLATAPSGRTLIVYQPDDSFNIVDVVMITDLEIRSNGKPSA
jgi:hypothetical protein